MLSYLIRRILLIVPTLIGATAIIFFVMALSPVSPMQALISREGNMTPGERRAREEYYDRRYGLNKPLPLQYLRWLNNISPVGVKATGTGFPARLRFGFKAPDLGDSIKQARPVWPIIRETLPVTLMLQSIAIPLFYAVAISSGIWTARKRGQIEDVGTGTLLLGLWSLPVIWVSVMLIGFLANVDYLKWFPADGLHSPGASAMRFLPSGQGPGYLLDLLWHLVLPIICLTYANFAFVSKLTRSALLETLTADFVRTARAKGLSEKAVLLRHALRNSLMPLITVFSYILPGLITGSVVVEKVFSIAGMGRLVVDSLFAQDKELFLSVSAIVLTLQLVGYLVSDLLYAVADPRVSYE